MNMGWNSINDEHIASVLEGLDSWFSGVGITWSLFKLNGMVCVAFFFKKKVGTGLVWA
jgi:hypothetical protein